MTYSEGETSFGSGFLSVALLDVSVRAGNLDRFKFTTFPNILKVFKTEGSKHCSICSSFENCTKPHPY
jgi:hypothetical protein